MNEKLELLKKCIELGANIEINLYSSSELTKEQAEELTKEIANLNEKSSYEIIRKDGYFWFRVLGKIGSSIFYKPDSEDEAKQKRILELQKELEELQA